ncbi:MAG: hypothetical protein QNK23_10645 [Crocinitomicaceae bacterium]|nr:hypothetical protein [Crocinitomicaceae bacterium]
MKKRDMNKLSMYRSVLTVIDNYLTSWSVLPAFQIAQLLFKENVTQIESYAQEQRFITLNSGTMKRSKRKSVMELTIPVLSAIRAYADSEGNEALYLEMKFAPSRLRYGNIHETMQLLNLVIEKAEEFLTDLADFGISQGTIDALAEERDSLQDINFMPRNKIVDRKFVTKQIEVLMAQSDALLVERLDHLVRVLKSDELEFSTKYFDARIIVDLKTPKSNSDDHSPDIPDQPDDGTPEAA